jgi:hypothetical protein
MSLISDQPPCDADGRENSAIVAARSAFLDARDALRALLEDLIEVETRAVCPTATDLAVEVYSDELGGPRGRLITVNTVGPAGQQGADSVAERIADLLHEWATTADADSTEIVFSGTPSYDVR